MISPRARGRIAPAAEETNGGNKKDDKHSGAEHSPRNKNEVYKQNIHDGVWPDSGTGCPPMTGNGLEMGTSLPAWLWDTLGAALGEKNKQKELSCGNAQLSNIFLHFSFTYLSLFGDGRSHSRRFESWTWKAFP